MTFIQMLKVPLRPNKKPPPPRGPTDPFARSLQSAFRVLATQHPLDASANDDRSRDPFVVRLDARAVQVAGRLMSTAGRLAALRQVGEGAWGAGHGTGHNSVHAAGRAAGAVQHAGSTGHRGYHPGHRPHCCHGGAAAA